MPNKIITLLNIAILILLSYKNSNAQCDCGSTEINNPCTGSAINVTVKADTPNGGVAVDSNFTWKFNSNGQDAFCGQFSNGDYWISPRFKNETITITSITGNGPISADVNPTIESIGLLNGKNNYGNYNSKENIIPQLPISFSGINSIVAAIQRNENIEGGCGTASIVGECVDSYNAVTILSSVPENAGKTIIRPNITGQSKEIISFSNLDFTRIPSKSYLSGATSEGLDEIRRRWSHSTEIFGLKNSVCTSAGFCSEGGRAFRSHILIDDYGAGTAAAWYNDLMILFSDKHSLEEKKPALAAMLAYGLDLYHAIYDAPTGITRGWGTGATQHPGKFFPPIFLAALMKDKVYANNLKSVGSTLRNSLYSGPLELAQIHLGPNGPVWGDIPDLSGVNFQGSYWSNLKASQCYDGAQGKCNPAIGAKNMFDPYGYIDGPPNKPGTSYMQSSLGVQRSMVATMFLMPEICETINLDTLVEYVDRVINHGVQSGKDPCVTPDSREDFTTCDPYRNTGCLYYGKTWGPVNPSDPKSQCITTPTPPYTKAGRFTSIDGTKIGLAYTSAQIEKNWSTIRGTSTSCRSAKSAPAIKAISSASSN